MDANNIRLIDRSFPDVSHHPPKLIVSNAFDSILYKLNILPVFRKKHAKLFLCDRINRVSTVDSTVYYLDVLRLAHLPLPLGYKMP